MAKFIICFIAFIAFGLVGFFFSGLGDSPQVSFVDILNTGLLGAILVYATSLGDDIKNLRREIKEQNEKNEKR